jgi:hypothetical protein
MVEERAQAGFEAIERGQIARARRELDDAVDAMGNLEPTPGWARYRTAQMQLSAVANLHEDRLSDLLTYVAGDLVGRASALEGKGLVIDAAVRWQADSADVDAWTVAGENPVRIDVGKISWPAGVDRSAERVLLVGLMSRLELGQDGWRLVLKDGSVLPLTFTEVLGPLSLDGVADWPERVRRQAAWTLPTPEGSP